MRKKHLLLVIGAILLIVLALGLVWYMRKHDTSGGRALLNRQVNLTSEQRKIYTDRISKAQDYLRSLNPAQASYRDEAVNTYSALAEEYYGLGDFQKSKEMYESALKLDPKNVLVLVSLVVTLREGGDLSGAESTLRSAIQDNPKYADAWLALIALRQKQNAGNNEIGSLYDQALKATDSNVDILTSDAEYQEKIGQTAQAISLWQEAKQKNPQSAAAYDDQINLLQKTNK